VFEFETDTHISQTMEFLSLKQSGTVGGVSKDF
jgi:hypothetical protein